MANNISQKLKKYKNNQVQKMIRFSCNKFYQSFKFISISNKLNKLFSSTSSTDTIFALSSGLNSAISIVRVSGPNAYKVLSLVNEKKARKIIENPRFMQFSRFYNHKQQIIDEGLIVYFPQNLSYNKEDIFELHLHGSKAVVEAIFKQLIRLNMRMAQRGQITKRAVINGKISLNQAEAINDLINSQTEFTRQISINNLLGKNMNYLHELKQQLVKSLAKSEAYIDFNQDQSDVKETLFDDTKILVQNTLIPKLKNLIKNYKNLKILKDGVNIVIAGKPNVGKSTLINLISNKNVSIVNQKAGTTRDIIQTSIEHQGFRLNLIDTAGLRNSDCQIQKQGIKRAMQKIQQCHVKILLIDISQEKSQIDLKNNRLIITLESQDQQINALFKDQKTLLVLNKIDLLKQYLKSLQILIKSNNYTLVGRKPSVVMSAGVFKDHSQILNSLSYRLKSQLSCFLNPNQIFFTRERYFKHLEICLSKLLSYIQQNQVDFACQYLRESIRQVESIFGRVDSEDVLDVLFRDFCIGK